MFRTLAASALTRLVPTVVRLRVERPRHRWLDARHRWLDATPEPAGALLGPRLMPQLRYGALENALCANDAGTVSRCEFFVDGKGGEGPKDEPEARINRPNHARGGGARRARWLVLPFDPTEPSPDTNDAHVEISAFRDVLRPTIDRGFVRDATVGHYVVFRRRDPRS